MTQDNMENTKAEGSREMREKAQENPDQGWRR